MTPDPFYEPDFPLTDPPVCALGYALTAAVLACSALAGFAIALTFDHLFRRTP